MCSLIFTLKLISIQNNKHKKIKHPQPESREEKLPAERLESQKISAPTVRSPLTPTLWQVKWQEAEGRWGELVSKKKEISPESELMMLRHSHASHDFRTQGRGWRLSKSQTVSAYWNDTGGSVSVTRIG